MSQLTLNLPNDIAQQLAEESRQCNRAQEEFALELIERALAIRRFRSARTDVVAALGENAPASDDDALKQIS